jgi:hypothetical protein
MLMSLITRHVMQQASVCFHKNYCLTDCSSTVPQASVAERAPGKGHPHIISGYQETMRERKRAYASRTCQQAER